MTELSGDPGSNAPALSAAPALTITLPLEGEPKVRIVAESHEEEVRLHDWIHSRPDIESLVRDAVLLALGRTR